MPKLKLSLKFFMEFKKDYRNFVDKLIAENGPAFAVKGLTYDLHFFANADYIKHVLFEKYMTYVRPPNKVIDGVLRDSAMLERKDQEAWKDERVDTLNALFNAKTTKSHAEMLINNTEEKLNTWEQYQLTRQALPLGPKLVAITLKNLSSMVFGNMDLNSERVAYLVHELFYLLVAYETSVTKLPWMLPSKLKTRTKKLTQAIHKLCEEIVDFCLSPQASENNLIKLLAQKYIPDYPVINKKERLHLAGRVAIFVIGGFENISSNLTWILIDICRYPLIANNIYKEVKHVLGARKMQVDDIDKLIYTQAVIKESLRLDAGSFIPRLCMEDDDINGYKVKKNDRVLLPVYHMHRLKEYWPNPEGFDPTRFIQPLDLRYQFVYLPFSAGPRACIGKDFAFIQTTIILAMIMQRYRLYLVPYEEVDPNFQFQDPTRAKEIMMNVIKAEG